MSGLSRIDGAIAAVVNARLHCPYSDTYVGTHNPAFNDPCPKCRQLRNGDGGTCVVTSAEHEAIKDIERAAA